MKPKDNELDVDFIGGQPTLTPEEEKALREFFQKKKLSKMRRRLIKPVKRSKVSV